MKLFNDLSIPKFDLFLVGLNFGSTYAYERVVFLLNVDRLLSNILQNFFNCKFSTNSGIFYLRSIGRRFILNS